MSIASGGVHIPDPIPIVDDNPEMDETNDARIPASKRDFSSDEEIIEGSSATSTQALSKHQKTTNSKGQSSEDKRTLAVLKDYLDNHFKVDEPIDQKTRNLLLRFGEEAVKHLLCTGLESAGSPDMRKMQEEMRNGFKLLNEKICAIGGNVPVPQVSPTETSEKVLSYAKVVMEKPRKEELNRKTDNRCYSILQPDNEMPASEDLANEWKTAMSRKQNRHRFKINNVKVTQAKNLAITFDSPAEQRRFHEEINREPIKGASIRSSSERLAHFAIRGVPATYSAQDVEEEIRNMNKDHPYVKSVMESKGSLDINDARQTNNREDNRRYKTFKWSVPMKYAKSLLDHSHFHLFFERVRVTPWKPNDRCTRCLRKAHRSMDCKERTVCKHCGDEHASYTCENRFKREKHRCVICHREKKDFRHRADVGECPILEKETFVNVQRVVAAMIGNHHG